MKLEVLYVAALRASNCLQCLLPPRQHAEFSVVVSSVANRVHTFVADPNNHPLNIPLVGRHTEH